MPWPASKPKRPARLNLPSRTTPRLGYGDAVATQGYRLMGPITALNGLLLIGWSVAIIFEVVKMADVQFSNRKQPD